MNCSNARDLLQPYLDSELETAETLAVNRHLERCHSCRRRFEAEQRIETAMSERLRSGPATDAALVEQVVGRVIDRPRHTHRTLFRALAAAALLVVALLWATSGSTLPVLVRVAAADHQKYRSGRMGPEREATDPGAVRAYLEPLLGVPCDRLPPPPGWRIVGPRLCHLKGARVGLVMLERRGLPVSLFVLPLDSARALDWEPGGPTRRFALGGEHAVVAGEGDTVLCAVGPIPPAELELLVTRR